MTLLYLHGEAKRGTDKNVVEKQKIIRKNNENFVKYKNYIFQTLKLATEIKEMADWLQNAEQQMLN